MFARRYELNINQLQLNLCVETADYTLLQKNV